MTTVPAWRRATAGALAALAALATSVLLDGFGASVPSLVLAVGQAVIRWSPGSVAREGVDTFGTADKPLLVGGIVLVSTLLGARAAMAAGRRPWAVPAAMVAAAAVGVVAAVTVADAGVVASLVAGAASAASGIATHAVLARAADDARPTPSLAPIGAAVGRRRFLTVGAAAAGGAALTAAVGRTLLRGSAAEAARAAVVLPEPTDPAPPLGEAHVGVDGATPFVTPTDDFYRIDEALVVPSVDLDGWRLRVTGLVDEPFELTYDELLELATVERLVTLACVSNEVGGGLVGNARWLGCPLPVLLERAGVQAAATQLVGRSVDGFTVGFPVETALDGRDALVAVGMNGEPLPRRHGFPARLVVPGLYGYVSATKWLAELELTTFDAFDAYWVRRGWSRLAPIKVQSRIDVPRDGAVAAGQVAVAGVAWAQPRGVAAVEVRVDGDEWRPAVLADGHTADTWRLWRFDWEAAPGRHTLEVRATDADGEVQDPERRPPFPDGATGLHRVTVEVAAPAS
jgi:DMSO/TMAO reductase YedYZ molybdopterin-dependent catalytic subunit